jgi:trans-aconitate 2-methyltransferase
VPTEWNAASYHQLAEPQFVWGMEMLQTLALRGDETVMDAGCGSGRVTAELLRRLPHGRVLAVDLSANMLERAAETLTPEFEGHVSFLRADLAALPFLGAVDGVFSSATFHWVPDHEGLFRAIFHSLKPGGWLVAQCGGGPNLGGVRGKLDRVAGTAPFVSFFAGWKDHRYYAGAKETAERLRAAGFIEVETGLREARVEMKEAAAFRAFVATVTGHPYVARIPNEKLRERFLDEVTESAAKENPPFVLDYWRLNMRARKP